MNLVSTIKMERIMKYQAENTVSSFFYYMWNAWSEEECKSRVWRHVPAFLGKMVRGDRQGHIRRGGTVLSGTLGRQPQAFGGTGRLDIRRTRPQKQEQKHKNQTVCEETLSV